MSTYDTPHHIRRSIKSGPRIIEEIEEQIKEGVE